MNFPELALAGLIVAAGIFALDQFSEHAAWLLTILILSIIAFRYTSFADELKKIGNLVSNGTITGPQDPNFDPTIPSIPLS